MKAIGCAFLILIAVGGAVRADVPRPPAEVAKIPVSMLVDLGSGQVLHAQNPDRKFLPASMTKVMTAYVAFQEISEGRLDLNRRFTMTEQMARNWRGRGTRMFLDAGDAVAVDDLLHGIMTASANDASIVLAEGVAGSEQGYLLLMNDTARRLGMTSSNFNTVNGWPDEGQTYVTARDLATVANAMIQDHPDLYRRYSGKKRMEWNGIGLVSRNPVIGVVQGADGIKTGYTKEAGYNFLGSAERDGRRLVMIVGGAESSAQRAKASRALLEWGFSDWRTRPMFLANRAIGNARVQGGAARQVDLIANREVYATIPASGESKVVLEIQYSGPIKAPIAAGQRIAKLNIMVDGMPSGTVPLYAANAVGTASPMDRLYNGFMNLFS